MKQGVNHRKEGSAHMGTTENVTLNVRPGQNPGQGWTDVQASNGAWYNYKYTGGHNNNGGLKTNLGAGPATLNLTLDDQNGRYSINTVNFEPADQLTWTPNTPPVSGTITFANTAIQESKYTTIVTDTQASNATIPCDPYITNKP
jgi:hypothetical protein